MARGPCFTEGFTRGAWTAEEDKLLMDYIKKHGEGKWRNVPKLTGLRRCGKSCRLRWLNYLRPDIKRGNITKDEEDLIIRLHKLLGNRWSLIAGRLPGRTDNEIKNYWNTNLAKRNQGKQYSNNSNVGEFGNYEPNSYHMERVLAAPGETATKSNCYAKGEVEEKEKDNKCSSKILLEFDIAEDMSLALPENIRDDDSMTQKKDACEFEFPIFSGQEIGTVSQGGDTAKIIEEEERTGSSETEHYFSRESLWWCEKILGEEYWIHDINIINDNYDYGCDVVPRNNYTHDDGEKFESFLESDQEWKIF